MGRRDLDDSKSGEETIKDQKKKKEKAIKHRWRDEIATTPPVQENIISFLGCSPLLKFPKNQKAVQADSKMQSTP